MSVHHEALAERPFWEGPVTPDDRQMLENIGCEWPVPEEEEGWLAGINQLIELGSTHLSGNCSSEDELLQEARTAFYELMPRIDASHALSDRNRLPPYPAHFIEVQRVLERRGIEQVKAMYKAAAAWKQRADTIESKLAGWDAIGLDSRRIAENNPNLLGLSIGSVLERLQPMYTAAALAGVADSKAVVHELVAQRPMIVNATPHKTRVLTRIGALTFGRYGGTVDQETYKLYIQPLPRLVAAYLMGRGVIRTQDNLIARARHIAQDYDDDELPGLIAQYRDDPVVKQYCKGYPIDDIDGVAAGWIQRRHERSRERWKRVHYENLPVDWQGPSVLGDPQLSTARALQAVSDYPELTEDQYGELEIGLIEAVLGSDTQREATIRRAIAARCVPLVVQIAESCRHYGGLDEKIAIGNLAVARVTSEVASSKGDWKRAGLRESVVQAVMCALEGYRPRFNGETVADMEVRMADELSALEPDEPTEPVLSVKPVGRLPADHATRPIFRPRTPTRSRRSRSRQNGSAVQNE